MSRNINRAAADKSRKTRRRNAILWSVAVIAAIIVLLALEQVALLYLVTTLGVAVLLIIVAFTDIHGTVQEPAIVATGSDAAAIADGVARTSPATSFVPSRPRAAKRRQRR